MNAYLVSIAFKNNISTHSSAAIVFSESGDHALIARQMLPLIHSNYTLLDMQIAELQPEVLTALANLAKEKGLV